jgi:hypothetical protein
MAILADLRAGADRHPGIDHGSFAHMSADIDKGRHHHDVGSDIGGAADEAAGHGTIFYIA